MALIVILVFAFLGFLDATYLTILHYQNTFPPCLLTQNCETVLTSLYSTFLGIPVSLFGSFFYLAVICLALSLIEFKKNIFLKTLIVLNILGFVGSSVFFYLQAFVLHAFCQYCLFSELMSLLILISSLVLTRSDLVKNRLKA